MFDKKWYILRMNQTVKKVLLGSYFQNLTLKKTKLN